MKLTGLLKNKVDAAGTKEEKKAIIADAGMELNDDELAYVTGGYSQKITKPKPTGRQGTGGNNTNGDS